MVPAASRQEGGFPKRLTLGGCKTLTRTQLQSLSYSAGWRGSDLKTAVAVAFAESGGRTCAVGDTTIQTATWGPSTCLWQIRSIKSELGGGGVRDANANLSDPSVCAQHAFAIWKAHGWSPTWSTFLHGTFKRYL